MNSRLVKRSALIVFALTVLLTSSVAQQPNQVEQAYNGAFPKLPGITPLPAGQTLPSRRWGYTHDAGTFLIDTYRGKESRGIFRSKPADIHGPLPGYVTQVYEKKMKYFGAVMLYGVPGRLFELDWTGSPEPPNTMPSYFFISAHGWHRYDVYSYRYSVNEWWPVGHFLRAPLAPDVKP